MLIEGKNRLHIMMMREIFLKERLYRVDKVWSR